MKSLFLLTMFLVSGFIYSQSYNYGATQFRVQIKTKSGKVIVTDSTVTFDDSTLIKLSKNRSTFKIVSREGNMITLDNGNTFQIISKKGFIDDFRYNTILLYSMNLGAGKPLEFSYFSWYKAKKD